MGGTRVSTALYARPSLAKKPRVPRRASAWAADESVNANTLLPEDAPFHDWYRFVLSYPPHLVRKYLRAFGVDSGQRVLDPFCGTGTTLVECKKNRVSSSGCDAHPFALLATRVKTNWKINVSRYARHFGDIAKRAEADLAKQGLHEATLLPRMAAREERKGEIDLSSLPLTEDERKILPEGFVSLRPMKRLLVVRGAIRTVASDDPEARAFFELALAHTVANGAGNFAFGPEIYRTAPKHDYDVLSHFSGRVMLMLDQVRKAQESGLELVDSTSELDDARVLDQMQDRYDAVITSPPYPNEKDYTRTTRVESVLLGLVGSKTELRAVKSQLLRSNTRNVFVRDDDGDEVLEFPAIQKICAEIEHRRVELGKTSGFERLYHKVVAHYFGGMRRHYRALYKRMRRGAYAAYVVGDQMSFLMVPIPTAGLLAELAVAEGFRVEGIDLWRERVGTKVRNARNGERTVRVREEVLILRKG
jgi:hypothetical protein